MPERAQNGGDSELRSRSGVPCGGQQGEGIAIHVTRVVAKEKASRGHDERWKGRYGHISGRDGEATACEEERLNCRGTGVEKGRDLTLLVNACAKKDSARPGGESLDWALWRAEWVWEVEQIGWARASGKRSDERAAVTPQSLEGVLAGRCALVVAVARCLANDAIVSYLDLFAIVQSSAVWGRGGVA